MVVCDPCRTGDHLRCVSKGWGGCRCRRCYGWTPGTAATPSVAPGDGEAASPRDTTAVPGARSTITVTPWMLGKLLCTVQGNDHYDTDYAPCSGCREMAEAIAASKAVESD